MESSKKRREERAVDGHLAGRRGRLDLGVVVACLAGEARRRAAGGAGGVRVALRRPASRREVRPPWGDHVGERPADAIALLGIAEARAGAKPSDITTPAHRDLADRAGQLAPDVGRLGEEQVAQRLDALARLEDAVSASAQPCRRYAFRLRSPSTRCGTARSPNFTTSGKTRTGLAARHAARRRTPKIGPADCGSARLQSLERGVAPDLLVVEENQQIVRRRLLRSRAA